MSITTNDFDEYYEGRRAFADGYGEDENPYAVAVQCMKAQEKESAWQAGWYAAEAESRN